MGRFLKFEKMITPVFIQLIFWVGTILIIIAGIITMLGGFFAESQFGEAMNTGSGGKIAGLILGILIIIFGPIILRVYCEMLIVIFKLQGAMIQTRDLLSEQNALLRKGGYNPPPAPPPPTPRQAPRQTRTAQKPEPSQPESAPRDQRQQPGSDIPPEFLE